MTDDGLRDLLMEIRELALRCYPFSEETRNDPELVFALGRIAGIASAALRPKDAIWPPPGAM